MNENFVGTDDPKRASMLDRAMLNAYSLRNRKEPINVNRWILDSGAFSQLGTADQAPGKFVQTPEEYVRLAVRFQDCGDLACIVTQDYMCEPEVLIKQRQRGHPATIIKHQQWTVERYYQILEEAQKQGLKVPVMPVLQGDDPYDYLRHWDMYDKVGHALFEDNGGTTKDWANNEGPSWYLRMGGMRTTHEWLGIGSTCKRNRNPEAVEDILSILDYHRPFDEFEDLKVHAFGLKKTALKHGKVRDLLHSADSMAPDFAHRVRCRELGIARTRESRMENLIQYQEEIEHQNVQTSLDLAVHSNT